MFATNEGSLDRAIRLVLGVALLALALAALSGVWQIVAGAAAVILLLTAAVGFCPLYRIFGISTCAVRPAARR
jgi:hypothetical protein